MNQSLCEFCSHMREIISGTGSRFVLCQLSQTDNRFPKYRPQPLVRCEGHERFVARKYGIDLGGRGISELEAKPCTEFKGCTWSQTRLRCITRR